MNDLISRQALCDDLREYKVNPASVFSSDEFEVKGYNDGIDLAISVISEFPSAKPEWKKGECTKINCPIQMNYISNDCNIQTCPYRTEWKKGEWIDEKINSYTSRTYCSECGSSAPFVYKSDDYYGNHTHGETVKTKFCPNCGAEMRGE